MTGPTRYFDGKVPICGRADGTECEDCAANGKRCYHDYQCHEADQP